MRGFLLVGLLLAGLLSERLCDPVLANTVTVPGIAPVQAAIPDGPGAQCRQAISAAEQAHAIPAGLLAAIGQVESGRRTTAGAFLPWPWTINAEGDGTFFDSKAQAIAAVRALQAQGVRSIDVGCMQVSLLHHPDAFASLDQAFDPTANADYAAGFLRRLYLQTNDWGAAAAQYHSATPALAADYRRKVMAAWGHAPGASPLATAWAATLGSPFGGVQPGALMAPRRTAPFRIIPAGAGVGGLASPGRGLGSYRARPIAIVAPPRAG